MVLKIVDRTAAIYRRHPLPLNSELRILLNIGHANLTIDLCLRATAFSMRSLVNRPALAAAVPQAIGQGQTYLRQRPIARDDLREDLQEMEAEGEHYAPSLATKLEAVDGFVGKEMVESYVGVTMRGWRIPLISIAKCDCVDLSD